jgi:hypothetical protein
MSLTFASLLFGLIVLAVGILLVVSPTDGDVRLLRFAKSRRNGLILLAAATVWFLFHVAHLGEADFGQYRNWLLALFFLVAVGSAWRLPEYLAIRSMAALALLAATLFLDAAFDQPYGGRLFMVSGVYLVILISLYLAVVPFRWRDFFHWLYRQPIRYKTLGVGLGLYGVLTMGAVLTY